MRHKIGAASVLVAALSLGIGFGATSAEAATGPIQITIDGRTHTITGSFFSSIFAPPS